MILTLFRMNNEMEDLFRFQQLQRERYGLQPSNHMGLVDQMRMIPQYQDQRYQPMEYANQRTNSPMQMQRPSMFVPQNDANNNNNNNNGQQTMTEKAPEKKVTNKRKEKKTMKR